MDQKKWNNKYQIKYTLEQKSLLRETISFCNHNTNLQLANDIVILKSYEYNMALKYTKLKLTKLQRNLELHNHREEFNTFFSETDKSSRKLVHI